MRYITRQPHNMSCGPVAVINALKWLGYSATYRDHINSFEWSYKNGIRHSKITKSLREYGVKFKIKENPTVSNIEKALDNGRSVMLSWCWYSNSNGKKKSGRHCVFIDKHTSTQIMSKNTWGLHPSNKDFLTKKKLNLDAFLSESKKIKK